MHEHPLVSNNPLFTSKHEYNYKMSSIWRRSSLPTEFPREILGKKQFFVEKNPSDLAFSCFTDILNSVSTQSHLTGSAIPDCEHCEL